MEQNGNIARLPAIQVFWDPDKQTVGLKFEPADFRTWDFVLGMLAMATEKAQEQKRFAQVAMMQHQAAEQQQSQQIAQALAGKQLHLGSG